jgi:tetratricopeptide (TPR) repeat protein
MTTHTSFERARQCFIQGNAAFETGRLDEAETHFQASLEALPGRPSTLINLAATRLRLGRPGQAIEPLRSALAAQPGDAEAWHHLGTALLETHQHAQALQALDRALALGLGHAAAHYRRGLALVELQRQAEAAQAWELALSLDDSFTAAWVDMGLGNNGHVVVKISKVVARESSAEAPARKEEMAQLTRWMAAAESVAYYNDLKEKLKVKIGEWKPKETSCCTPDSGCC